MKDAIAVLNAGSSSIKFSLFRGGDLELVVRGQAEAINTTPRFAAKDPAGATVSTRSWDEGTQLGHDGALQHIVDFVREHLGHPQLAGIGHRVVHGGLPYAQPVRVDGTVLQDLAQFVALAPLHQPHNLTPIRLLLERQPELPQVACFDTAFHRAQPELAQMFALPRELHDAGVQRYGFHGLSYEYIASVLPEVAPEIADGRVIVAHLGSGASMCALKNGRSIDSSFGFTALDGLCMGTRPGSVDPGVILYLFQNLRLSPDEVETILYKRSGLLGVSGLSNDMRVLLESKETAAKLAVDYFVYRAAKEIGALAATLGGIDGLVFTAGIGENSPEIRSRICEACAWLGVELDAEANVRRGPRISTAASGVSAWTIPTNEELMIARHTWSLLGLSESTLKARK